MDLASTGHLFVDPSVYTVYPKDAFFANQYVQFTPAIVLFIDNKGSELPVDVCQWRFRFDAGN